MAPFLSTLSLRRATAVNFHAKAGKSQFLSTLSLRRATTWQRGSRVTYVISIHALLAESDNLHPGYCAFIQSFLSTLSLRRATKLIACQSGQLLDFYPRSPCGERLKLFAKRLSNALFLSTLSLRRATLRHCTTYLNCSHFYPRSPCGERPCQHLSSDFWRGYFYPRSPCGERRARLSACFVGASISIHALLAESDLNLPSSPIDKNISIHALLAESDVLRIAKQGRAISFLSTLSLRRATEGAAVGY